MDKQANKEICQTIYCNLIELHHSSAAGAKLEFFRELFQTETCYSINDFSSLRQQIQEFVGSEPTHRVLNYQETEQDERIATHAVTHYFAWHHKQLLQSLNWQNFVYYHTIFHLEQAATAMGIGASGMQQFLKAPRLFEQRRKHVATANGRKE